MDMSPLPRFMSFSFRVFFCAAIRLSATFDDILQVATDGWVRVHWDAGQTNSYRMGKENMLVSYTLQNNFWKRDSILSADRKKLFFSLFLRISESDTSTILTVCYSAILRKIIIDANLNE